MRVEVVLFVFRQELRALVQQVDVVGLELYLVEGIEEGKVPARLLVDVDETILEDARQVFNGRCIEVLIDDRHFRHEREGHHGVMHKGRTNPGDKIVNQETLAAPVVLYCRAEHPQGEHVEEKVAEVAVHEHISDQLPRVVRTCGEKMQPKPSVQIPTELLSYDFCKEE